MLLLEAALTIRGHQPRHPKENFSIINESSKKVQVSAMRSKFMPQKHD
jgi:hypothetical protein